MLFIISDELLRNVHKFSSRESALWIIDFNNVTTASAGQVSFCKPVVVLIIGSRIFK